MLRRILSSPFLSSGPPVLVAGLIVTIVLFNLTFRLEQEKIDVDFREQAEMYIDNVQQGFNDAIAGLESLNLLFDSVGIVTPEEFGRFARPLLARYPYVEAFTFNHFVQGAERQSFENAQRQRVPGYAITELSDHKLVVAAQRPQYLPQVYIEPIEKYEARRGFDALSQPQRGPAIWRAINSGQPAATGIIKLVIGATKRPTFFVTLPVYRHGMPLTTPQMRREAAIGVTNAVMYANDLIAKTLSKGLTPPTNVGISVYTVGADPTESKLVYRHGNVADFPDRTTARFPWNLFDARPQTVSRTFDFGGVPWRMEVSGPPAPLYSHRGSLLILFFGTLLSMGAASLRHAAAVRSQRIEQLVKERTAELTRTARDLKLRQRAIEASANAIIIASAQGPDFRIEYVNPAFERITGFSAADAIGQNLHMLYGTDLEQPGAIDINAALREGTEGHAILRQYRKDGTRFWSDVYIAPVMSPNGRPSHFVVMQYDITEMKRYEAELEFKTNYDTLTGLANRNLLRDRLIQALAVAARYNHRVCVAYIDLDRFKFVNDSLGHRAGDAFLTTISQRLKQVARETDTVARYGSDEFVLVLPDYGSGDSFVKVIQSVMEVISQPILIDGKELFPTCSIGLALYPNDGTDFEMLLTQADIAMYNAKESGRNRFRFYAPQMNERTARRLRLEGDLRRALDRQEFLLHYQPQVDVNSGRIVGVEALIRWRHPEFGLLPPASFISLAEETGLIVPIGEWVLRTACAQARQWERDGFDKLRIAVNLSARQFAQADLVQTVMQALSENGLTTGRLELEITESMVMADVGHAIEILHKLKDIQVHLSIDDFGTGFSSLSYLKRFPIDVLKVDQSFVHDIASDPDDAMIAVSIIALAHHLRLKVIAEGVETAEQLTYLREHGCDMVQGYYFSRPLPVDALEKMLQKTVRMPA